MFAAEKHTQKRGRCRWKRTGARQQQLTSIQHRHTAKAAHAEAVSHRDRKKNKNITVGHQYSSEKGNGRNSAAQEVIVLCSFSIDLRVSQARLRRGEVDFAVVL